MIARGATLALALAGCAARDRSPDPPPVATAQDASTISSKGRDAMTQSTCEAARDAIANRRFVGWRGIPAGCTPAAMFGIPATAEWGMLRLGGDYERVRTRLLELPGYYRPIVYERDGAVALFDGTNPEGVSWKELAADLGHADIILDWVNGTVPMPQGEHVFAGRGITVFVNAGNDFVAHVSVYTPTTAEQYMKKLRVNREKKLRP